MSFEALKSELFLFKFHFLGSKIQKSWNSGSDRLKFHIWWNLYRMNSVGVSISENDIKFHVKSFITIFTLREKRSFEVTRSHLK